MGEKERGRRGKGRGTLVSRGLWDIRKRRKFPLACRHIGCRWWLKPSFHGKSAGGIARRIKTTEKLWKNSFAIISQRSAVPHLSSIRSARPLFNRDSTTNGSDKAEKAGCPECDDFLSQKFEADWIDWIELILIGLLKLRKGYERGV